MLGIVVLRDIVIIGERVIETLVKIALNGKLNYCTCND